MWPGQDRERELTQSANVRRHGSAAIAQFTPQDATTNPSLILAAVKDPKYAKLIKVAVDYAKQKGG